MFARPSPFGKSSKRRDYLPEIMTLVLSVLVGLGAYWIARRGEAQFQANAIHKDVAVYAQALEESLTHLVNDVQALAQFHDAMEVVTGPAFSRFTRPFLERHPYLLALEWVPRVSAGERAAFEAQARAEGLKDFQILEWVDGTLRPAAAYPEYFPLYRVEFQAGNVPPLGFDVTSEPLRRAVLERARDTGQPVVSPPLTLVQDSPLRRSLIIYVPQIRGGAQRQTPEARQEHLRGFTVGVVRLEEWLAKVVAPFSPRGLDLLLRDPERPGAEGFLVVYPSRTRDADPTGVSLARHPLGQEIALTVAGSTLVLRGSPVPGAYIYSRQPLLLLGLSLAGGLALTLLVHHRRRLRKQERLFRLFMDHSAALAWIKDDQGRYVYLNQTFERYFGVRLTDARGKTDAELWPGALTEAFQASDRTALAARQAIEIDETTHHPARGLAHWRTLKISFQAGGHYVGGLALEITAQRQAERELRRYRRIVDTSGEMLLYFDRDLRYQVVNPAYAALHGLEPADLKGRFLEETLVPAVHAQILPHLHRVLAGEDRRFSLWVPTPDGRTRYLDADARPFQDQDGERGVVVSLHDLTETREAQAALEAERAHLEQRVLERTAEWQGLNDRLRLATEVAGIGIWEWDLATGQLRWDARVQALYGWREEDGPPSYAAWLARVHPEDRPGIQATLEHLLAGERTGFSNHELRLCWPDGQARHVLSSGRLLRDADGQPARLLGVNWDISEQRRKDQALRESEQRFSNLVTSSPDLIWEIDTRGVYTFVSPRIRDILGYAPEEVLGRGPFELMPPEEAERIGALFEEVLQAPRPMFNVENLNLHKDGRQVVLETSGVPIFGKGGELIGFRGIDRDITQRKEVERQLQEALERAERATRVKSDFLAHMSHEIRTPLHGILGLTELVLGRPLDPINRDDLEKVLLSGRGLLVILNDILDAARIEAGRLTLDRAPFDLDAPLKALRGLFDQAATAKGLGFGIQVAPEAPRALVGDVLRLQQVLSNLLSNAIKFTDQGRVDLEVAVLGREDARVRLVFRVTDTGIGMDTATQERLFAPFTQGDDSIARRFGGTGLGLSISRDLVRLMGGSLTLDSAPGRGSQFRLDLTLDLAPPAEREPTAAQAPGQAPNLAGARVLVAEDHPINQRVVCHMLNLLGVQVTLANNGREALERLAEAPFDAVLMDVQMPELDGLSATERIRAHPAWADLPVIALTAGGTEVEQQRIRASGMTDVLLKPATLEALTHTLGRWLKPGTHRT